MSVCSFRLCGSIVANPIIYRLVLSPSRYEIRQWFPLFKLYELLMSLRSQVRLWPWIYHKNLKCRYWNEIMCATVVTFKTKHTVGGRKISFGRPAMHVPVIEVNLHNVTSYQKQRLFSFNCKQEMFAKVNHVVDLQGRKADYKYPYWRKRFAFGYFCSWWR